MFKFSTNYVISSMCWIFGKFFDLYQVYCAGGFWIFSSCRGVVRGFRKVSKSDAQHACYISITKFNLGIKKNRYRYFRR